MLCLVSGQGQGQAFERWNGCPACPCSLSGIPLSAAGLTSSIASWPSSHFFASPRIPRHSRQLSPFLSSQSLLVKLLVFSHQAEHTKLAPLRVPTAQPIRSCITIWWRSIRSTQLHEVHLYVQRLRIILSLALHQYLYTSDPSSPHASLYV
jgi:hypothetical protein